jgi:hypothetical protein
MGFFDDEEETSSEPGVFESIGAAAGRVVDDAVDTAASTAEAVVDGAAAVGEAVVEGAAAVAEAEYDGAVAVGEAVYEGASTAYEGVSSAASGASTVLGDIADDAYDAASAASGMVAKGAESAYDSAVQGVEEAYDAASQTAQEIYDDPAGAARSAVSWAADEARAGVDAAEDLADRAIDRLETDPEGAITYATTLVNPFTPTVDIDSDASDGTTGVHYSYYGVTGETTQTTDDAGNTTYHAGMGTVLPFDDAPKGSIDLSLDQDNNFNSLDASGNITVPIEGVEVGLDGKLHVAQADDGRLSASGEYTVTADVEGVDMGGGQHFNVAEREDGGFDARVGTHQVVDASLDLPGTDEVPGTLGVPSLAGLKGRVDEDVDLSVSGSGQVTAGVHMSDTITASVLGEDVAEVKYEGGVHYTTGPDGERVIVDGGVSGQIGNEDLGTAGVSTYVKYELGSDAQGNDVDRVTVTDTATIDPAGDAPAETTVRTHVYDDATGIDPALVTGGDEVDVAGGIGGAPGLEAEVVDDLGVDIPITAPPPAAATTAPEPLVMEETAPLEMPTVELGDLVGDELATAAGDSLEQALDSFDDALAPEPEETDLSQP